MESESIEKPLQCPEGFLDTIILAIHREKDRRQTHRLLGLLTIFLVASAVLFSVIADY